MPQMLDTIGNYNAAFHRVNDIDDNVVSSDHSKVWNSLDVKALSHSTLRSASDRFVLCDIAAN